MRGLVTHPAMFLFHPLHLVGLGHGADCNQKTLYRVQGAVRIIVVEGLRAYPNNPAALRVMRAQAK
ncbi:MAG: hypothetical protein OXI54_16035, partial [Chloroflexota bacterium]|nr:hypothetical protein [Chloroflexota bacterium]